MTQPVLDKLIKDSKKMGMETMGQLEKLGKAWVENYDRMRMPAPVPAKDAKIEDIVAYLADKGWKYEEFMEILKKW